MDSIACRRGAGGSGTAGDATAARVLNQLLVEMDGMTGGLGAGDGCDLKQLLVDMDGMTGGQVAGGQVFDWAGCLCMPLSRGCSQ